MKQRRPLAGLALFFSLLLVWAAVMALPAAAAPNVPEQTPDFYVADYAEVLTEETTAHIVDRNQELYTLNGAEIVVLTVDLLDGADIEDYTTAVFNDWAIGSADYNNGVLLVLAIGEDNYYIQQGVGLESTLTSGKLSTILDEYLEPDFAAQQYDAGVRKTFDALYDAVIATGVGAGSTQPTHAPVATTPPVAQQPSRPESSFANLVGGLMATMVGVVVIALLIVLVVLRSRRRYVRGYGPPRTYSRGPWGYRPPPPPPPGGYYGAPPPPPPRHHRMPPVSPPAPPPPPRRSSPFGGDPRPKPPGGGWGSFGGGRAGGGGASRGGGAGRSASPARSRPSPSRPSGGSGRSSRPSGGGRSGGGGASRGGGAGRRK